jgi:adenine-specific DNA-methyltransferase
MNNLGQYFTKNLDLQNKVYEFILNNPNTILEPSCGRGDLIKYIQSQNNNINFDLYEIDNNIQHIIDNNIIYCDFLQEHITNLYKTIIGNPPYVKTKSGNLYIDFIKKCYNLLENNGELIFIIPSDFFKLTSSSKLLNEMLNNGTFTHIYHPHNENLFENASIDIIIFRYCKNNELNNEVLYNDELKYLINKNGLITFENNNINDNNIILFSQLFEIAVGQVSGCEEIYKNNDFGNIELITEKDVKKSYILIDEFPTQNEELNNYMLSNKEKLINRKIRKFNENNWYEWGALRNIKLVQDNFNKDCIYIHNLSRKEEVAFIDKVNYFNGNLLIMIPKENNNINLQIIVDYLNNNEFKKNYIYSGRFKIGHKNLCNSYIHTN